MTEITEPQRMTRVDAGGGSSTASSTSACSTEGSSGLCRRR